MKKLFKVAIVLLAAFTLFVGCTNGGKKAIEPVDGVAEGNIGDTFKSYWFDFLVDEVKVVADYNGYTAQEGFQILEVKTTIKSTVSYEIPVYSNVFYLLWSDSGTETVDVMQNEIYGEVDTLAAKATKSYVWYFEVPVDETTYAVGFEEVFDTTSESDKYGDVFYIYFTPKEIK